MRILQPSRRSSLSSHSPLPPHAHKHPEGPLHPDQVARNLDFLRKTLRDHLKDRNFLFEEEKLKEMNHRLNQLRQHHHSSQRDSQETVAELRTQLQELVRSREEEAGALRAGLRQELEAKERECNHKLLAINNDHGRKEQSYKEVIEKLMAALAEAQKKHQALHLRLNTQLQAVGKTLQAQVASQRRSRKVGSCIRNIAEEIVLRQENSMISSKSGGELSLDEMELPNCQPAGLEERDSALTEAISEGCLEKQIQGWLERLVCFGFFEGGNEKLIRKMIDFTKRNDHPTQLLEDKMFPPIVDVLVSNMRAHEDSGWRYLRGASGLDHCGDGSLIELRNINNLSELEVNSACEVSLGEESKRLRHF